MPLPTDNVPVTPGSGIIVAADGVSHPDLGDVLIQLNKIADGRTNGTDGWKINPDNSGDVTVVSSVLPTGAATETTLAEIGADLDSVETTIATLATESTLSEIGSDIDTIETNTGHITDASQKSQIVDGSGNVIGSTGNALDINVKSGNITGFATETTLSDMRDDVDNIEIYTSRIPAQGQALAAASMPIVLTALQVTTLTPPAAITNFAEETGGNLDAIKADLDTINTNIAEISSDIDTIETNSTTIAGAITASKMATTAADGDYLTFGAKADPAVTDVTTSNTFMSFLKGLLSLIGVLSETAPATDTASSGLNGRLQRVSQGITSFIALLPTALGQGTMAQSLRVVLPSDQSAIPTSQSGTWSTRTEDGSGTAITSTGGALDINIKSGNPTGITANAGTNLNTSALALEAGHLATVDTSTAAASTTLGGTADAIVAAGATGSISAKLRRATQGLADLLTGIVLAAGSNIIGKVGIDQTTPGTTNAVQTIQKEVYAAKVAFAITMNSLGIGSSRQADMITGNTNKHAIIHVKAVTGSAPTANTSIDVYLIRSDGTYADDSAGSSDAAITIVNAIKLGPIACPSTSANQILIGSFDTAPYGSLGSSWTVAVTNNTGQSLNAANNGISYELVS